MAKSKFSYTIAIRASAKKVWDGLTLPKHTKLYWVETWQDCVWKKGASWKLMIKDGRIGDSGKIVAIEKHKKIVIKWRNEFMPAARKEGYSLCTIALKPEEDMVVLSVTHEMDRAKSKLIEGVSGGWPLILSSLKSLLETGTPLKATSRWPESL